MTTPLLSREDVRAKDDLITERVEVPEWGGAVLVKVMQADEKAAWEKSCQKKRRGPNGTVQIEARDDVNVRVTLAVATCVNADGSLLFEAADVVMLGTKSAAALERIFAAACRLNRIGKDDIEELEDEEKNS